MIASPNPTPTLTLATGLSLAELLAILWEGRWIILGSALLALLLCTYYVWRATPIYQMEAMLQVEAKQTVPARVIGYMCERGERLAFDAKGVATTSYGQRYVKRAGGLVRKETV